MRVLLSEGSSTSAREAITALGLKGHEVEICDPDPVCLGRFSRFVKRFHRCPGLGVDAEGYLAFIVDLVSSRGFDVLVPIHEQGYLLARAAERIRPHVAIALPSFESYARVVGKVGFIDLLVELGLPSPPTRIVGSPREVIETGRYPMMLKTDIGTASRGVWKVRDTGELRRALGEMEAAGGFERSVLVQDFVAGTVGHAQAVFDRGCLLASHAYLQIASGAGGGDAIKESIPHAALGTDLARIGSHLRWSGALTLDYILDSTGSPLYIDCNPRLVEPMCALLAGLDLVDILLRVSLGEAEGDEPSAREGVRTHLAMQALLGSALEHGSRRNLLAECWRLLAARGPYAGSREELTPIRLDWPSAVPAVVTALWLLANPRAAHNLPRKGWGAHLLTPESVRRIASPDFASPPDAAGKTPSRTSIARRVM